MSRTFGLIAFPGFEELDLVGPWEVLTMATLDTDDRVVIVAEDSGPMRCAKGMRIVPDYQFTDAPELDVVLVPGGDGTQEQEENEVLLDYVKKVAAQAEWVTSVCTGAMLLHAAGLIRGRRVATHWGYISSLRERAPETEVVEHVRYVRDGNVVTAAGVSAGIDMTLWLVGQIFGVDHARRTQRWMEYDPAPPYAADV